MSSLFMGGKRHYMEAPAREPGHKEARKRPDKVKAKTEARDETVYSTSLPEGDHGADPPASHVLPVSSA